VPRWIDLAYWPFVQMVTWGFMQTYLLRTPGAIVAAGGVLIGAMLLWDVLVRCQLGFSVAFLEEVWSRNLGHLLMSPLRPSELVLSLIAVSLIRLLLGLGPVALLAYWFFGFNILTLGPPLAAFLANLILTGLILGIATTGLILRFGQGAETLVWSVVFTLLPLCCVYYPLSTMPGWLQPIALMLPPTSVFEGLRGLMLHHEFLPGLVVRALALNGLYGVISVVIFTYCLRAARNTGSLVQMGE
jgi:ABC-2 type transport system permease protein